MNSTSSQCSLGGYFSAIIFASATHASLGNVVVDGIRNASEFYSLLANQTTVSNWNAAGGLNDQHEALANLHAVQSGSDLSIHLAARVKDRGIILFIDSKAGGRSFISNNLITFGGEENFINNFGSSSSSGMTFESGFLPDHAVRIYGDGGTGAFVNTYDLTTGTRAFAGNAGVANITSGFISDMRAFNLGAGTINNTAVDYAAAVSGAEMKLNLAALGVQPGVQNVKLMAVLVTNDSTYGSNQVLASRSVPDDIAEAVNSINFEAESGSPTLAVAVTGPDSRNVAFNVNMSGEIVGGFFTPGIDQVKVLFFSGSGSPVPGELFLTDLDSDQVYSGTFVAIGTAGDSFGNYKYFNTAGGAPNGGFEYGADRNFVLDAFGTTQTRNETFTGNSFALWSSQFSESQPANQDRDGDGIANGLEYFMGSNNSTFTPNPQLIANLISWPRDRFATGVSFKVWRSADLSVWENVTSSADITDPNFVKFTVSPGELKRFVRLEVSVP